MTIGEKIKQLRKEKRLTQEELGELLGVKKSAIQKYESGQVQNLKQATIKKLCKIFNKYPDYFLFDELEDDLRKELSFVEIVQKRYGDDVYRIFETVIDLNEESLKKVAAYVDDILLVQTVKKNNL